MAYLKYGFLPLGSLFGFLLSRAGATTYDYYANLFLFQDFRLLIVMATAGAVGMVGVAALKRLRAHSIVQKAPLSFAGKPYKWTLIPGALLFGAGWGLAGACPGTALAMMGEGKMGALFAVLGVGLGTYLFGLAKSWQDRRHHECAEAGAPTSG